MPSGRSALVMRAAAATVAAAGLALQHAAAQFDTTPCDGTDFSQTVIGSKRACASSVLASSPCGFTETSCTDECQAFLGENCPDLCFICNNNNNSAGSDGDDEVSTMPMAAPMQPVASPSNPLGPMTTAPLPTLTPSGTAAPSPLPTTVPIPMSDVQSPTESEDEDTDEGPGALTPAPLDTEDEAEAEDDELVPQPLPMTSIASPPTGGGFTSDACEDNETFELGCNPEIAGMGSDGIPAGQTCLL
eukprot:scaffold1073_cov383-Prasinococcus_capsulatus_cf.AAC.6